jgi:hypothetical protein
MSDSSSELSNIDLKIPSSHVNLFVISILVLSALGVIAIITVFAIRPDKDNTAVIATILGFLFPAVTAFIAASVREMQQSINGRLTQMLELVKVASKAAGKLEGKKEARTEAAEERLP